MMVRLPDLDTLKDSLEPGLVEEYLFNFVNMLSTLCCAILAPCWHAISAVILPCYCRIAVSKRQTVLRIS